MGWLGALTSGCVTHYVLPMTSGELVDLGTGKALVVYLGQPDASPSVCDTKSKGPHVSEFTSDFQNALVQGFVDGKIQPALWERCVKRVLRNLPEDRAAAFHDQLAREHSKLMRGAAIEENPEADERLVMLQNLYLDRAREQNGHPEVVGPLFEELRQALGKADALGPVARDMGRELLATADIEKGRWQDQDVTIAMLDELAAAGNTMTLERFARRLPDPELRAQASRRIVRINIALSPFSEVRDAAQPVEERVLAEGNNRVSLAQHPLVRAWFDPNSVPMRSVLVRQDVWRQSVKLLGSSAARQELSVLPELPFRGALWAELKSISRPVSVCDSRKNFDPSPCLGISDISLDNPFTYLDRSATFHFHDGVSLASVVPLAAVDDFSLPVRIAGVATTTLSWGLSFERPADLQFSGAQAGSDGPDLNVQIERPHPSRLIFYATDPSQTYLAIVESRDLGQFHVASAGARGYAGADGSPGMDGSDGAQCQDGGNGSDGGPAGNGGPGGDGGDVHVRVFCGQYNCNDTLASVRSVVLSLGGAGGPGGRGGAGGRGGSGGSGRSPTTYTDSAGNTVQTDAGCSAGSNGNSGNNGADGYDGPNGSPGRVTFETVP
jgi:hypothetical protein